MKMLLDVNIWIDTALRPESYPESGAALRIMQERAYTIGFPLSGYTTVYYLLNQYLKKNAALEFLKLLEQTKVKFLGFDTHEVTLAQTLSSKDNGAIRDHEDACIVATALTNKYDWIVTRNMKDFKKSNLPTGLKVGTPKQIMNLFHGNS